MNRKRVFRTAGVLATFIGALAGLFAIANEAVSWVDRWEKNKEPTELVAHLKTASFQGRNAGEFTVEFRNPTATDQAVQDFAIGCNVNEQKHTGFFPIEVRSLKGELLDDSEGLLVKTGRSLSFTAVVDYGKDKRRLNQKCASIGPIWRTTDIHGLPPRKGDYTEVDSKSVFYGS